MSAKPAPIHSDEMRCSTDVHGTLELIIDDHGAQPFARKVKFGEAELPFELACETARVATRNKQNVVVKNSRGLVVYWASGGLIL